MPIAYADPDTLDFTPGTPTPYDEEYEYDDMPVVQTPGGGLVGQKMVWLGFTPPSDRPIPGALRARKSKGKKALLRSLGADG